MIQITKKEDCCGCYTCASICPRKCISMREDAEGFLYPYIDKDLCVNCHLCEKVCPVILSRRSSESNEKEEILLEEPPVYVAQCKDDQVRLASSSGGVFTVLALQVLKRGGVVFGARWNEDFSGVQHTWVDRPEELALFRGSKYLQSKIGGAFEEVQCFLKEGRPVLFTGTPCQVKGLKSFLRGKDEGLLAVAVACHSSPSPKVWRTFLSDLKERLGFTELTAVGFRKKKISNDDKGGFYMEGDAGYYCDDTYRLAYGAGFLKGLFSRPVCQDCPARGWNYGGDLIIGDFWGAERYWPDLNVDSGLSVVVCCTETGRKCFEEVKCEFSILNSAKWSWALIGNGGLNGGMKHHPLRAKFFDEFLAATNEKKAVKVMQKFVRLPFRRRLKGMLRELKKWMKMRKRIRG